MAVGTINLAQSQSSGKYIDGKIEWSSTPNNNANNSDVVAKIYVCKGDTTQTLTSPTYGTWSYNLTVNGKSASGTKTLSVLEDWVLVHTMTVSDIGHNNDGSKSISISGSVSAPSGTSFAGHTAKGSGTAKLDTIPRASTIDSLSCATKYFDGTMTYKYTPQSSSYYNRCNISLNLNGEYIAVTSIVLGQKPASQQTATVTLSADELATIYNELPNGTKGTLRFTFRTYIKSDYTSQVGDAKYKEIELEIPENSTTKPSVSMTLTPENSLPSAFASVYVQGKSKVKATISATGKNNADIKSYSMSVEGNTYDSVDDCISDYLSKSGSIKVIGYAKDTREFTGSAEKEITVYPYDRPKIQPISGESDVIAARCDKNGNFTDSGTYLKIRAKRRYSSIGNKNTCEIRYRYKADGASDFSDWETIMSGTASGDEVTTAPLLGGELLATNTYIVQVGVIDTVGENAHTTIAIPTDKVYMHRDGARRSFAFGGYIEEDNTFSIAEDIDFKVKHSSGESTIISDTGWVSLGLADNVIERENSAGRIGKGCYYRVINNNHVYVAFCCEFYLTNNTTVIINKDMIPAAYRPQSHIYQLCICDNRAVARCKVTTEGAVGVDWVQVLSSNEVTSSYFVSWIDGYIDYWITDR